MTDRPGPPPPRAARPAAGSRRAAVVCGVAVLLVAGAWLARREVAAGLLSFALGRAGFADATLTVVDVGPRGIELRDLHAGGSALAVGSLTARWSLARLARGRIDELSARGVRLRADLRGPSFVTPAASSDEPGVLAALAVALPRNIHVEDAHIDLETDLGTFTLALRAQLGESDDELRGEASLDLVRDTSRAKLELSLQGSPERFEGTLALDGAIDDLPDLPLALAVKGQAQLRFRDRVLELYTPECVELRLERLVWGSTRLEAPLVACAGESERPALQLELTDDGATYRAEIPLRAPQARIAFGSLGVAVREPRLDLKVERLAERTEPSFTLDASAETSESAALELRAEAWNISARLDGGTLESTLAARALRDLRKPASVAPLALRGSLARKRPEDPIALRFELASAGRRMVADGKGSLEPDAGRAHAQLKLRPLAIGPGATRLADLSPALGRLLGPASGRVEATVDASWSAKGPRFEVDLALRDATLATRAARFTGVNGRVLLQGPSPWSTPPDQLVSAALTEVGLPLTDGLLRFQLRPDAVVAVESATWRVMGGTVRMQGPLDLAAELRTLALDVRGIDLAEVTKAAELRGLSGTGRLDGRVPLRFAGESVFLDGADLHSTGEGGIIQYRPSSAPSASGSRPELTLALRALEDFRYQELRITLEGDVRKAVTTGFFIRGSNPQLERGRPVEFNVKVDAPLAALLRSSLATYRLPDAVERRLRDFPGAELR